LDYGIQAISIQSWAAAGLFVNVSASLSSLCPVFNAQMAHGSEVHEADTLHPENRQWTNGFTTNVMMVILCLGL
jgi:hypothetical protein